jgi:hypothetical protein
MRRGCALALILAASCGRCGAPQSAATAEELLPQHPSGAVVTAPLGAMAEHFAALADRVASLPGGEMLGDLRKGLMAQLGFDPLTRDGLVAAGVDPQRGAAVALLEAQPRPEWIVALPLSNPDIFMQTIERLLVERAGFAPVAPQPGSAKVFERGTSPQKIALAVVRGYGLLSRGVDPASLVAEVKIETSLLRSPGLAAARQKLGAQDLIVWAPAGSELPKRYTSRPLPGDVALSLQGAPKGLALRLVAQLPPADAARARAALPGGGAALVGLLPDAPLRARLGVAPARLLELLREDARLGALLERLKGVDEVFAALQPGAAVSLGVTRTASIAQAVDYGLDWRRKSPFDTVQLVALAQVAEPPRLLAALEALAKQLPKAEAKVARSGNDFQVTYAAGQGARFGMRLIDGKPVAYLLGGDVKPDDLRPLPKAANPEAAAFYADPGASVRADFGKLAAAIHALPESTYGTGPQSYVTRSVVAQVIDPLRPLRLTLDLQAQPDFLDATLDVEIAAP